MSTEILPQPTEQRGIKLDRSWLPRFGRVIKAEADPVAATPRPAAPPQPLPDVASARAALAALDAASKLARATVLANPELAQSDGVLSGNGKRFNARWVQDMTTAMREAAAEQPLSILKTEDWFRIRQCLDGQGIDSLGVVALQRRIVNAAEEQQILVTYSQYEPKLRKMDLAVAKALCALRDAWQARIEAAEKIRRPLHVPAHPQLRTIGNSVALLVKQIGSETDPEHFVG